jgi:hypothetical protein
VSHRIWIALFLASGIASAGGQDLWRSCAACHCVPDLRIAEDENWLKLNETTTCIAGEHDTPESRRSLIEYLRAKKTLRPLLIDEKHPGKGGTVQLPSTPGSAYLKADRASVRKGAPAKIRLRWRTAKSLQLPAGAYRVISYSFYRKDKDGRRWVISGSSAQGCADIVSDPKKPATFALLPQIRAKLSCKPGDQGYLFGFFMTNRGGARLSVARDGALVDPAWLVRDERMKIVDRGDFEVS